ncbi:hypothetical protein GQ53DRAFT_88239 [Thozetella sp. PMI_491]|nr:hypothetical protein GQ53DRAFT_88239 [Thozetella sp. PMI_491]
MPHMHEGQWAGSSPFTPASTPETSSKALVRERLPRYKCGETVSTGQTFLPGSVAKQTGSTSDRHPANEAPLGSAQDGPDSHGMGVRFFGGRVDLHPTCRPSSEGPGHPDGGQTRMVERRGGGADSDILTRGLRFGGPITPGSSGLADLLGRCVSPRWWWPGRGARGARHGKGNICRSGDHSG